MEGGSPCKCAYELRDNTGVERERETGGDGHQKPAGGKQRPLERGRSDHERVPSTPYFKFNQGEGGIVGGFGISHHCATSAIFSGRS